MKREHSRKPDEVYDIIEACSWGPRIELFARGSRDGWATWGDQSDEYAPSWPTYANHSAREASHPTLDTPRKAASLSVLPARKKPVDRSVVSEPGLDLFAKTDSGFSEDASPVCALLSGTVRKKRRAA